MFDRSTRLRQFLASSEYKIALMGMSGVGKTTLARLLPQERWFHYSVDYRIGTRYLNEAMNDFLKLETMKNPILAPLLRSDSITIAAHLTIDNLAPLSVYLGMVGDAQKQGLSLDHFLLRLMQHRSAEIHATNDVVDFMNKAKSIYDYPHFLCDTSGSFCELADDATWQNLAQHTLLVYLESTPEMLELLIERAKNYPKPLYYQRDFLLKAIDEFCQRHGLNDWQHIDPSEFVVWVFPRLIAHRLVLYRDIAQRYGITINARETANINTETAFIDLVRQHVMSELPQARQQI